MALDGIDLDIDDFEHGLDAGLGAAALGLAQIGQFDRDG